MKILFILLSGILCFTLGCHDEADNLCNTLKSDILNFDVPETKAVLNIWLSELQPDPSSDDLTGHQDNIVSFVDRLKKDCDFNVSIECYACIETYPVQSEVNMMIDSSGVDVRRVLDILTPSTGVMSVVNIHR